MIKETYFSQLGRKYSKWKIVRMEANVTSSSENNIVLMKKKRFGSKKKTLSNS